MKKLVSIGLLAAATAFAQWQDFSTQTTSSNLFNAMNGKVNGQTGIGAPAGNCTTGKDSYIDTSTSPGTKYYCDAANHWTKIPLQVLVPSNNLSDVGSVSTARANLGLGSLAVFNNPMTTAADIIVGGSGGTPARLATPGNGTWCFQVSAGVTSWVTCPGSGGGITSITLAVPAWLTASPVPFTSNGTLTISAATGQTSHQVIGTCGTATSFGACALVAGDIPALPYQAPITTGTQDQVLNGTLGLTSLVNCVVSGGVYQYSTSSHTFSCHTLAAADVAAAGTLSNNTSGTASNLSGTPALPNGTTGTTQSANDNSTKLATTAYVDAGLAGKATVGWQKEFIGLSQGTGVSFGGDCPLVASCPLAMTATTNPGSPLYQGSTVFASLPSASSATACSYATVTSKPCLGATYLVTDCLTTACAAGSGSIQEYLQSNGTAWAVITTGRASLDWPTAQSTYLWQFRITLPSTYNSGAAINYTITYRSGDSTHAAILTPSWGCTSTADWDTPTLTAVSTVNLTAASGYGRAQSTNTISPTCAVGNALVIQFALDTNTNSLTAQHEWASVLFYQ